jgi:hypothetical protein
MCGIAGVSSLNGYTRKLLPFLAYEMERRGDDSWGIANHKWTYKHMGSVLDSFKIPEQFEPGDAVSLHTRAASVGKVSAENSHPFLVVNDAKDHWVRGMHNGCVYNYRDLAKEYNYTHEVDSPHVFKVIVEGGDTKNITGWGTLVWWEGDCEVRDGRVCATSLPDLYIARYNSQNLYVCQLESGEVVWASTEECVTRAVRMTGGKISKAYTTKGDQRYRVKFTWEDNSPADELMDDGAMVFGGGGNYNTPRREVGTVGYSHFPQPPSQSGKPGVGIVSRTACGNPGTIDTTSKVITLPAVSQASTGVVGSGVEKFSLMDAGARSRSLGVCVHCCAVKVDRNKIPLCDACWLDVKFEAGLLGSRNEVVVYGEKAWPGTAIGSKDEKPNDPKQFIAH